MQDGRMVAFVAYPLLPWMGVMALGYGLGPLFVSPRRDQALVRLAIGMLAAFLVLRGFNLYGDPRPWMPQIAPGQTVMAFLDVQKYPPSLLFVCATLGPMLLLVPAFDRLRGPVIDILRTFGSVPLMTVALLAFFAIATGRHIAASERPQPSVDALAFARAATPRVGVVQQRG